MHAVPRQVNCLKTILFEPWARGTKKVLSSLTVLGFAELFGEGFAVGRGEGVEAVEDLQIDDEGDDREGEEDGDHEPGAVEIVGRERGWLRRWLRSRR